MTKKQFLATLCLGAISFTSLPAFAGTTYEVPVKMMHAHQEGKVSMANQALKQTAEIEVEDQGSEVQLLLKPMEFSGQKDGVNKLFVLEDGKRTEAVKTASQDPNYPDKVAFHSAQQKPEQVKVAFWVNIMDELAGGTPGAGAQDAYLKFDWQGAKTTGKETAGKKLAPQGSEPIQVFIKEKKINFDTPPFIEAGRTLVPVRFISENLGATVKWDAKSQKITIEKGDQTLVLQINQKDVQVTKEGKTSSLQLDAPAQLKDSRTFVPLRFISEAFGSEVGYQRAGNIALITLD